MRKGIETFALWEKGEQDWEMMIEEGSFVLPCLKGEEGLWVAGSRGGQGGEGAQV